MEGSEQLVGLNSKAPEMQLELVKLQVSPLESESEYLSELVTVLPILKGSV